MTGVELIAAERTRQVEEEGYDAAHDDEHKEWELSEAAYDMISCIHPSMRDGADDWGLAVRVQRRAKTEQEANIRILAMAGALIAAEIDRLLRLTVKNDDGSEAV